MGFGSFILAELFWNELKENLCEFWGFCLGFFGFLPTRWFWFIVP